MVSIGKQTNDSKKLKYFEPVLYMNWEEWREYILLDSHTSSSLPNTEKKSILCGQTESLSKEIAKVAAL